MSGAVFSAEALDANRNGQLSAGQRRGLQAGLGRKHSGLAGLVGRAFDPLAKDLQAGRVESIEGAITKRAPQSEFGGTAPIAYRYRVQVANRQAGNREFRCSKEFYEFAPDAGMVRLFYLPRSPWAVNLEFLPDAPAGALGEQGPAQAAASWAAARKAHDEVATAEAAARIAALHRQQESAILKAQPSTQPPADPRALAEAIIGTWQSPFLTASLRHDGTFAARLADGSDHQGQWSVDASGRLHADVMGSPMVAGASVDADELTPSSTTRR
jgi:hypothetical protein